GVSGHHGSISVTSGQDVVLDGRRRSRPVSRYRLPLLVYENHVIAVLGVQIGKIHGDQDAFGVVPGTGADAILGVDGCAGGSHLDAEIRVPRLASLTGGSGQILATFVGA